MLFLTYWELNEVFTPKDVAKLSAELMEKGLWPVEGAKMLGWYVTSDVPHWGITLNEAETVEQVMKGSLVWENAKPGLFKVLKARARLLYESSRGAYQGNRQIFAKMLNQFPEEITRTMM